MKPVRKSQVFMFDFIFAFVILVVSFGILISFFSNTTANTSIYDANQDLMHAFTTTPVNSLNDEEIRTFFVNRQIRNIGNTVAQQVGEFYNATEIGLARDLTQFFADDYITPQMNANITLIDDLGNQVQLYAELNTPTFFNESDISSATQRVFFGYVDNRGAFGPYNLRIEMWQ